MLIEGPSDFTNRLDELASPHELPVGVYRYLRRPDGVQRHGEDDRTNLCADADLRRSEYVRTLCAKLGVDSFVAVWDVIFELDTTLTPGSYLERAHSFCVKTRWVEEQSRPVDRQREAFIADQLRAARVAFLGVAVVVTGGYHSLALHARLSGVGDGDLLDPPSFQPPATHEDESGIMFTPCSYERLDSLTGYNAGMPNPGF